MDFIYWFYIIISVLFLIGLGLLIFYIAEPPRYYLTPSNTSLQVTDNQDKMAVLTTGTGIPFYLQGDVTDYVQFGINSAILYVLPNKSQVFISTSVPSNALTEFEYVNQQVKVVGDPTRGLIARGTTVTVGNLNSIPSDASSTWTYVAE